jgi:hypothetical protein
MSAQNRLPVPICMAAQQHVIHAHVAEMRNQLCSTVDNSFIGSTILSMT